MDPALGVELSPLSRRSANDVVPDAQPQPVLSGLLSGFARVATTCLALGLRTGVAVGKINPGSPTPGGMSWGEAGEDRRAVRRSRRVVGVGSIIGVGYEATYGNAALESSPTNDLVQIESTHSCVFRLVGIRTELAKGARNLDEAWASRYFIDVAIAARAGSDELDSHCTFGSG